MLGRRSVMPAALGMLVVLTTGTGARQAERSAAPEIVWQFKAGG